MNLKAFLVLFFLPFLAFSQNTAKPWAFWWWPASAVNEADIQKNLKTYAAAGFGGLHIIPIYGVKGEEAKTIPYLSERWVQIVAYTAVEAKNLNMGIDMTLGTGWPYGGSWLKPGFEAQKFTIDSLNNTFKSEATLQKVKRASPGAEGLVLDHFSKKALDNYLLPFDKAFSQKNIDIRAFYNDSYEVYGANWTPDFPAEFKKRRGYAIVEHSLIFKKKNDFTDLDCRVISDYKETISDLLLSEFTKPYTQFSKKDKHKNRNQAHGSPANVLDLYAAVDIPESEFFGSKPYNIPYHYQDPEYKKERFGEPDWKVLKLASSPANLTGKSLVSSETATWLGNHFKVMLSQIKPVVDESFLGGINHIFYHGIPYSPPDEPFPGWLFYASTNFNQNSHFWNELPLINKYVENCQKLLQKSTPDNEVLVYFPIHDMWQKPKASLDFIDVHAIKKTGIFTESYISLLDNLKQDGYQFDFISDLQLTNLLQKYSLQNTYKAIIVPAIKVLPLHTLKNLIRLDKAGIKVMFIEKLPETVNGFKDWEKRQKEFDASLLYFKNSIQQDAKIGLEKQKVFGENLEKTGLSFLRKKVGNRYQYFISILNGQFNSGKIKLKKNSKAYIIFDPLDGTSKHIFPDKDNFIDLYLPPGKSIFITQNDKVAHPKISTSNSFSKQLALKTSWSLNFTAGKPNTPRPTVMDSLFSWTSLSDTSAQYYYGECAYASSFALKASLLHLPMIIDLGDVRATATIIINGKEIGKTWSYPHALPIPLGILKPVNTIEIRAKNTSFNYVRLLDKNKYNWKKFYDINIVNINYQPFDASNSAAEQSGLLGPVLLRY